ncbi:MAG: MutS-related protein [Solirubrobacteraceae bacterium]
MKARLMFEDRDFQLDAGLLESLERPRRARDSETRVHEERVGERDLIGDLELEIVWNAMARDDVVVYASSRTAMLSGVRRAEEIRYRHAVLTDCMRQPAVVREIYGLAVQAIAQERRIWRSIFSNRGEPLLRHSISVLELLVTFLRQLRKLAEEHADGFHSEGFGRFFDTICRELDDDYFVEIAEHLRRLRFRDGVLMSARLGDRGQGIDYVLRSPRHEKRGLFRLRRPMLDKPTYSHIVPPRDHGGGQALGRLRDRGVSLVANALGQSTDHILSFFAALRAELGFYVGCLNLHEQLADKGEPACLPEPHPLGTLAWSAQGLYDPCLSLRLSERVQGNDLHADGKPLLMITGANQGGKSTFLRGLGIAQLMMQAGMFVAAESFSATITNGVFSHYKREEDATMTSGKFDEELARMSQIVKAIDGGCLLICNESFSATNEHEGSQIADEFIRAMNQIGVKIAFVTHLYDLAHRYHEHHGDTTLFLRADRGVGGQRSYRIIEAEPLPTSYGEDLYRRTFGDTSAWDRPQPVDGVSAPPVEAPRPGLA